MCVCVRACMQQIMKCCDAKFCRGAGCCSKLSHHVCMTEKCILSAKKHLIIAYHIVYLWPLADGHSVLPLSFIFSPPNLRGHCLCRVPFLSYCSCSCLSFRSNCIIVLRNYCSFKHSVVCSTCASCCTQKSRRRKRRNM